MYVPLPRALVGAGEALGIIILLATFAFLWIVFRHQSTRQPEEHEPRSLLVSKVFSFISQFSDGVREIGFSNRLYSAIALSCGMLVSQILALWFLMHACRIALPMLAAFNFSPFWRFVHSASRKRSPRAFPSFTLPL